MGACLTAAFLPVEVIEDIVRDCLPERAWRRDACAVTSSQPPNPRLNGAASGVLSLGCLLRRRRVDFLSW